MKHNTFKELIRYGLCGGLTTCINLVLFYLFTENGVYYIVSNIISYYIAVVVNYLLNDYFVFQNVDKDIKNTIRKMLKFLELRTVSLVIDTGIFFILVTLCDWNTYVCRILLSAAIILLNFIWSKRKIFK